MVSLNNDDVCLQDGAFSGYRRDHIPDYTANGDDPYIRGYSGGAQKAWLEHTLRRARSRDDVDWIVVVMHQVAMSSAHFNGADLGIRQEWLPLFDNYGVDLVVAGHEHHFERTFAVRGTLPGNPDLLTPAPQGTTRRVIDTTTGTVHMIIGGGGHPGFTPGAAFDLPHDGVLIVGVKPGSPQVQRGADHRHRARPVVGLPGRDDAVRLRHLRRGPRRPQRHHDDHGHPLRCGQRLAPLPAGRPVHAGPSEGPRRRRRRATEMARRRGPDHPTANVTRQSCWDAPQRRASPQLSR